MTLRVPRVGLFGPRLVFQTILISLEVTLHSVVRTNVLWVSMSQINKLQIFYERAYSVTNFYSGFTKYNIRRFLLDYSLVSLSLDVKKVTMK